MTYDLSTLAHRMRQAAGTIEDVNKRYKYNGTGWTPDQLRREARHVEDEDQEAYERNAQIDELALDWLQAAWGPERGWDKEIAAKCANVARKLIESGWRKAEPT
jgi:hypothetical protein